MTNVLDMASHKFRKLDCQNENDPTTDTLERRISAAGALSRFVRTMEEEFDRRFILESLANEMHRVRMGVKS